MATDDVGRPDPAEPKPSVDELLADIRAFRASLSQDVYLPDDIDALKREGRP